FFAWYMSPSPMSTSFPYTTLFRSLSSFVTASWTQGPVQVVRYNSYESIRIGGSAAPGYSTGEAMAEMEAMVAQLPNGFGYEWTRSEEHTSELQSREKLVCRLLLDK